MKSENAKPGRLTGHEPRADVFSESTTVQSPESELEPFLSRCSLSPPRAACTGFRASAVSFIGQMVIVVSQQDRESIPN